MNYIYLRITLLVACICAIGALRAEIDARAGTTPGNSAAEVALPPELQALLAEQPRWTMSSTIETAVGVNDNVLLSAGKDAKRSDFTRLNLETLLWHVPARRIDYFGFVNGELTHFFSGKATRYEGQAFAGFEWRYRIDEIFSFAMDEQGYYVDQIFDISDTDVQQVAAELKVTGGKLGPTVRWSFVPWMWVEASAKGARENLKETVVSGLTETKDRTTVTEPTLRIGFKPLKCLELSFAGIDRRRKYTSHPRYTRSGQIDQGVLAIRERELNGQVDGTWGSRQNWKTTTRAGLLQYSDNGVGYLNYFQRSVAQEVEWSVGSWLVHVEGEVKHKQYELQEENIKDTLNGTANRPLIKEEFAAGLRIERRLSSAWTLYAAYDWERTRANDFVVQYRVNEGLLGARWNWEK